MENNTILIIPNDFSDRVLSRTYFKYNFGYYIGLCIVFLVFAILVYVTASYDDGSQNKSGSAKLSYMGGWYGGLAAMMLVWFIVYVTGG